MSLLELKEQGNKYFKEKNYQKAIELYGTALKLAKDEADKSLLYSNQAACYVSLSDWPACIDVATKAINSSGEKINQKALYRRATANTKLRNYEEAFKDLRLLKSLNPNDKETNNALALLHKESLEHSNNQGVPGLVSTLKEGDAAKQLEALETLRGVVRDKSQADEVLKLRGHEWIVKILKGETVEAEKAEKQKKNPKIN